MSDIKTLAAKIKAGECDQILSQLYGSQPSILSKQRERYLSALAEFEILFPEYTQVSVFSASGRTEIGGNHTDHNHGRVLAAAVNMDVIGIAAKCDGQAIVHSKGFAPDEVSLADLSVCDSEKNTSRSLIKGVCARHLQLGFNMGGFVAYTTSNVLKGSGLSSSAAFEVLLCTIQNHFYNDGKIDPVTMAKISQYAENVYFGKPCGLMDQMASAVGGFITIDFADTENPVVESIHFDFNHAQHTLCIVDTGGNHADLTCEYADITKEMRQVANYFGQPVLRFVSRQQIVENAANLRMKFGDRALLRAIHFVEDNERVKQQADDLKHNDFEMFLSLVNKSGHSSFMYLQNVYAAKEPHQQGLSVALMLSDLMLGDKGAYRVHGGGFGGTIQAFVPNSLLSAYMQTLESVFGEGSCHVLNIRPCGGIMVF